MRRATKSGGMTHPDGAETRMPVRPGIENDELILTGCRLPQAARAATVNTLKSMPDSSFAQFELKTALTIGWAGERRGCLRPECCLTRASLSKATGSGRCSSIPGGDLPENRQPVLKTPPGEGAGPAWPAISRGFLQAVCSHPPSFRAAAVAPKM
jgi:hypothetical protein